VSINLSPKQFVQPTLADDIIAALGAHGIPPKTLKLEITEGSVMEDLERSCALLAKMRGFGVGVALDDFGVGYSSLGVLNRLPIDTLKVDQIFISRMSAASDDADSTIVQSIASMARSLHMVVVAEGLEEKALAKPLQAMGCEFAQGFAFARPLNAPDATELLDDQDSVDQASPAVDAPGPVKGLREQVRGPR
jgi:EAL domain-containing protein (putative c-di-GMP-specific phosphodiesterase class I)